MRRLTLLAPLVVLAACSQGDQPTGTEPAEAMDAPLPSIEVASLNRVSPYLIGEALALEPAVSGGMLENGFHDSNTPESDSITNVFGSFGPDRDRGTGSVTYTFEAAASPSAVPLITGPGAGSITVAVHCEGPAAETETLPVTDGWTWYEVPTTDCGDGVPYSVTFADSGSDWGQWLAVGEPHLILDEVIEDVPAEDIQAGQ